MKIRPRLPKFTFVFLGLALSVFTWGLQYKLSLYDPPQAASHLVPEAKLLSGKEQAQSTDGAPVTDLSFLTRIVHPLTLSVVALFLLALDLPSIAVWRLARATSVLPWRLQCRASFNVFFFRPPPLLS